MGHPHKCCSVKKTGRKSGSFRQTDIQSVFSGSSVAGKDFSEPDLTEGTYSFKGDSYTYQAMAVWKMIFARKVIYRIL